MEEFETRAERLLAAVPPWLWDGEALPVPIEDIVDSCFGIHVREIDDLATAPGAPVLAADQAFSGLLLPDQGEIWVNAEEAREWPPRRRFTIGHELGHWCLHRSRAPRGAVFCRKASVAEGGEEPGVRARPPEEEEANAFAAALLMPAALLRAEYKRLGGDFEELCRLFGASGAAMGRRLHAVI